MPSPRLNRQQAGGERGNHFFRGESTSCGGAGSFSASPSANPVGRRRRAGRCTRILHTRIVRIRTDGLASPRSSRRSRSSRSPLPRWRSPAERASPPATAGPATRAPARAAGPVPRRLRRARPRSCSPTATPSPRRALRLRSSARSSSPTGSTTCPTSGAAVTRAGRSTRATTAPAR
jgi:hypothetical protein